MEGRANETFVRSIKAIVYMMKATGMMCSQRWERICLGSSLDSVTSELISGLQGASKGETPGSADRFFKVCGSSHQPYPSAADLQYRSALRLPFNEPVFDAAGYQQRGGHRNAWKSLSKVRGNKFRMGAAFPSAIALILWGSVTPAESVLNGLRSGRFPSQHRFFPGGAPVVTADPSRFADNAMTGN